HGSTSSSASSSTTSGGSFREPARTAQDFLDPLRRGVHGVVSVQRSLPVRLVPVLSGPRLVLACTAAARRGWTAYQLVQLAADRISRRQRRRAAHAAPPGGTTSAQLGLGHRARDARGDHGL